MSDIELEYLPPYTATWKNGKRIHETYRPAEEVSKPSWIGHAVVADWRRRGAAVVLAASILAGVEGYKIAGGAELQVLRDPAGTVAELHADLTQVAHDPIGTALAQLNRLGK